MDHGYTISSPMSLQPSAQMRENEGARVFTTLYIDFSDAQGQLTPYSVFRSCLN